LIKGLWFDLVVAAVLITPNVIYETLLPYRWRSTGWHDKLQTVWLFTSIFLLILGAVSEFTFWVEFSNRLNFIALDYLIYTSEVIGNIRESYPVGWIVAIILAASLFITWRARNWIRRDLPRKIHWQQRIASMVVVIVFTGILIGNSNIEQMEDNDNAYASELSGNGLFTFAAAAGRNELDYLKFYRTLPPQTTRSVLTQLGVSHPLKSSMRRTEYEQDKAVKNDYFLRRPKNLILVSVESLSASFLGSYGSDKQLTPNLDVLARGGLKFDNVYATGTRTVRGLEALSLGTPPIPGQAIVRRPHNHHLSTLGEVLRDQNFDTFFFYGGYGYFDNMNRYFDDNNYQVIDRTDIPSNRIVFENVWGVADEVLFDSTIDHIDQRANQDKPFFAHVMTTTNHRPYTYPNGRIDIPSPGGRDGAVKYTDYAIGKFIRDAQQKPWFRDTLFVFVADHCASVAGKTRLPVKNYRIPLILYSPGNLKSGVYTPMISQIDIVPSLIEAMGKRGDDLFFGRSFFESGPPLERAFISNYQELGYLRNGKLTVLLPKQRVQSFDIDPETFEATPAAIDDKLLQEAIAYYQSASTEFKTGQLRAPFLDQ
ncbi:MAG: LTA synthase family protein, partial [Burkholderiales bacterium]|nr:LTA synthase family protein [Burkholderiales bacterium]